MWPCTPPVLQCTTRRTPAGARASSTWRVPSTLTRAIRAVGLPRLPIGRGDVIHDLAPWRRRARRAPRSVRSPTRTVDALPARSGDASNATARGRTSAAHRVAAPRPAWRARCAAGEARGAGDEHVHARGPRPDADARPARQPLADASRPAHICLAAVARPRRLGARPAPARCERRIVEQAPRCAAANGLRLRRARAATSRARAPACASADRSRRSALPDRR